MKFELDRLPDYSRKSILAEPRRVALLIPHKFMTIKEFNKYGKVSVNPIYKFFGLWHRALTEAGLGHRITPTSRFTTNKQLLAQLRLIARKKGSRTITCEDLNRNGSPHFNTLSGRFGSFKKALLAAGLKPSKFGRKYTDDECFTNLKRVWMHYGRAPTDAQMSLPPSTISKSPYIWRFGSWYGALQAFVQRINRENRSSKVVSAKKPPPAPPAAAGKPRPVTKPELQRDIPVSMRFQILCRDRFRCRLCGNNPATNPRCQLHVDHITPFSKGGKTQPNNLRSLCSKCNLGRSNRYTN